MPVGLAFIAVRDNKTLDSLYIIRKQLRQFYLEKLAEKLGVLPKYKLQFGNIVNDPKECLINDYVVLCKILKTNCYPQFFGHKNDYTKISLTKEQESILDTIKNRNKIQITKAEKESYKAWIIKSMDFFNKATLSKISAYDGEEDSDNIKALLMQIYITQKNYILQTLTVKHGPEDRAIIQSYSADIEIEG